MEMPVPPIYVIELDDGKYELIDGLQRISSYLSYRGLLKIDEKSDDESLIATDNADSLDDGLDEDPDGQLFSSFELEGCEIISELNGLTYSSLQASMQIKLKRAFVRLEILRKGINPEMKYHMFKRLNDGGEKLYPQEIRNCTIRLIDDKFINYIKELKHNEDFRNTISKIGAARIKKRFDEELVLRYFAFKNNHQEFKHDVGAFLTRYVEKISLDSVKEGELFDYEKERERFKTTFKFLNEAYGDSVFCMINPKNNGAGVFNGYIFEAVSTGIQDYVDTIASDRAKYENFKEALLSLKSDQEFRDATVGGGKNSPTPLKVRREKVIKMMKGLCE